MVIPYMPMLVPPVKWTGYGGLNIFWLNIFLTVNIHSFPCLNLVVFELVSCSC